VYTLGKPPAFVPAFMLRGAGNAGANLMNAASSSGFGRFGGATYMFLYAGHESRGMYLTNELAHLHNLSSAFGAEPRGSSVIVFAGASYAEVHARVQKSLMPGKNEKTNCYVDFHEVYKRAEIPISLLSCDETGALQLAVMSNKDHKAKIARASFGEKWESIDTDIPEADGRVRDMPLIIGVDMDIRRAKRIWEAAERLGRKEVLLAALPGQLHSIYIGLLPKSGIVTPLAIETDLLSSAFGKDFSLYDPKALPAKDEKGDFIRV
jgi:hypothetical protein